MVEKLKLGEVFLRVLWFSFVTIIPSLLLIHSFITDATQEIDVIELNTSFERGQP